jgi:Na+/phosphate symporter
MFNVKPYLILVVLVGAGLLFFGLTFLSAKVAPLSTDQSSKLVLTVVETIAAVGIVLVALFGGLFRFMKSRFEDHSHKH